MKKNIFLQPLITILFLLITFTSFSQDKIINQGEDWMYYDEGTLENNWAKTSLNNTSWKKGVTPLGYGDKKIITEISYGKDKNNKQITKYFKKTFTLKDPLKYIAYEFKFQRDDGIVIYLNGEEIHRDNLPKGIITGKTKATYLVQKSAETMFLSKIIDSKDLKKGKNTISISIHQVSENSSDCIFNFELLGHNNPNILSILIDEKTASNFKLETEIKNLSNKLQQNNDALKIDFLTNSNDNFKLLIFLLLFFLVTVAVISYYMFLRYRKKEEQAVKELLEVNKLVFEKDKEMMVFTTQLLQNKQSFKEIKTELNYLKTSNTSTVKNLIQQINFIIENDDEWDQLKKHFNTVYSGFYDLLINLHPTLTEIELRHCMFIKLHMQTKEIARILHIDPRSVQASRYRIKKKMKLSEGTDLRNYIIHVV